MTARALDTITAETRGKPWLGWLLVCLCRQRVRQDWLILVRDQRLANLDQSSGEVPGLAGWRYDFHGRGLCLSGPDREHIDVDFYGDGGATIDPYFFAHRVLLLDPRPVPESRLASFLPTADVIALALGELRACGLIGHPESRHVFRLRDDLEAAYREVAAAAQEGVAFDGEVPGTGAHRRWILEIAADSARTARAMPAAAMLLDEESLVSLSGRILAEHEVGAGTGTALEVLETCHADATKAVSAFLDRIDPSRHHPYSATCACRYLLERAPPDEKERALGTLFASAAIDRVEGYTGNPMISDLALLALEYAPKPAARTLAIVRRALRGSPLCVQQTVALLASLDQRWCHREIVRALEDETSDSLVRRRLARALQGSASELARRRGRELFPPAPAHDDGAVGFTFDEVDAAGFEEAIKIDDKTAALAARLRAVLEEDWGE